MLSKNFLKVNFLYGSHTFEILTLNCYHSGMLDKSDLQQIKKLLHEEVDPIKDNINLLKGDVSGLKDDMKSVKGDIGVLKGDVSGLKDDMKSVKGDISVLKGDVSGLKDDMKSVKGDIGVLKDNSSKIRKDINTIVSFFDREYVDLRDRVSRIEEILKLTPR